MRSVPFAVFSLSLVLFGSRGCSAFSVSRMNLKMKMTKHVPENMICSDQDSRYNSYSCDVVRQSAGRDRRIFLGGMASSLVPLVTGFVPLPANALDIKVTPVAHTFLTSSGAPKPVRENDATRLLTNARVVYLFVSEGGDSKEKKSMLSTEVLTLTAKRKAGRGSGVTPGQLHVATFDAPLKETATSLDLLLSPASPATTVKNFLSSAKEVSIIAASLPEGDTLVVGPIASSGVAAEGKLIADCANYLGVEVGGAKSGGVISVVLDGPRQNVVMEEQGYPTSTLLWYSI